MSVNLPELTQLVAHMNHKTIYVNLFQKLHNLTNKHASNYFALIVYERHICLICGAFSLPWITKRYFSVFLQDEGNKIAHFSSSNNTLFLCVLWKVLLDTDYISNVAYKVLDRIGTKQLVSI